MTRPDRGALEAARHGAARSPHWHTVEREFLAANPTCLACGGTPVQAHHRAPFHYLIDPLINRPDLELDARNLVSLCEDEEGRPAQDHHLLIGHLGNFREGNLLVREDAEGRYHGMTADAIRADAAWGAEERDGRLKPLDRMTDDEKRAFRARLDAELPPDPAVLARFGIVL